jgi:hypothetical protein
MQAKALLIFDFYVLVKSPAHSCEWLASGIYLQDLTDPDEQSQVGEAQARAPAGTWGSFPTVRLIRAMMVHETGFTDNSRRITAPTHSAQAGMTSDAWPTVACAERPKDVYI